MGSYNKLIVRGKIQTLHYGSIWHRKKKQHTSHVTLVTRGAASNASKIYGQTGRTKRDPHALHFPHLWNEWCGVSTALLKVEFGSRIQSRVPDIHSTFDKQSTLKSTLLDFKSCKSDLDSTPPRRSTPSPKPIHRCLTQYIEIFSFWEAKTILTNPFCLYLSTLQSTSCWTHNFNLCCFKIYGYHKLHCPK